MAYLRVSVRSARVAAHAWPLTLALACAPLVTLDDEGSESSADSTDGSTTATATVGTATATVSTTAGMFDSVATGGLGLFVVLDPGLAEPFEIAVDGAIIGIGSTLTANDLIITMVFTAG